MNNMGMTGEAAQAAVAGHAPSTDMCVLHPDLSTCSSASSASSSSVSSNVFDAYINKYPDLLAAYNAGGGGQSKTNWGKKHYCNGGNKEPKSGM